MKKTLSTSYSHSSREGCQYLVIKPENANGFLTARPERSQVTEVEPCCTCSNASKFKNFSFVLNLLQLWNTYLRFARCPSKFPINSNISIHCSNEYESDSSFFTQRCGMWTHFQYVLILTGIVEIAWLFYLLLGIRKNIRVVGSWWNTIFFPKQILLFWKDFLVAVRNSVLKTRIVK